MKELGEALGFIFFIAVCFAVAFIFQGEPDLWDKWHDQSMGKPCVESKEK